MNLGIFLSMGDSFNNMAKNGQDVRFKRFYLTEFSRNFSKVFVFSYRNEKVTDLPENVLLVPNKYSLHRYIYAIFLPVLNYRQILSCSVIRVYHLFGTPPAIISKIVFLRPFIFNYAYNYQKFAKIESKGFVGPFINLLELFSVLLANKVIAANKIILKKLGEKAIYIPNGVDTTIFRPLKRQERNKPPVILSVGRLEKSKNFENLVKAMKGIKGQLIIVGTGSLKNKLEDLAKTSKVNLKIIKKVDNTRMPTIYNKADIFILASLAEGSPKALLEAMSCRLPVIGSATQEVKEIIDNKWNGLLAKPYPKSLSAGISEIIINEKFSKMISINGRKTIVDKFDLKVLLQREIRLLRE